jgi:hypothetical protein
MSRQYCVLFYGTNEPYSMELFEYLKRQPFDFFAVTGLAKVCVNKPSIKATLIKNGITKVPCVLIKYYNQAQDHFEGDQIYTWIDSMAHQMGYGYEVNQQPLQQQLPQPFQQPSSQELQQPLPEPLGQPLGQPLPEQAPSSAKITTSDSNIMDAAKALQKDRDMVTGSEEGKAVRPPVEGMEPPQDHMGP